MSAAASRAGIGGVPPILAESLAELLGGGAPPPWATAEPIGSSLPEAPDLLTGGAPPVRDAGGCFELIRIRGGAEDARERTAEALAAAFFEIPKSAAFLAMLEVGSEPGFLPGDLLNP